MEFKTIIYIVLGVIYFIYSVTKKAQENKQQTPSNSNPVPTPKPVSPPTANPLEEIMREIKRKQAEADAQKKIIPPQPKPLTTFQQKKEPKEMLIRQKQKDVFAEGNYERDLTPEEMIERGKLKIVNEGIYKIKSVEEMNVEESNSAFQLNMRDAIVGSVILERKF